MDSMILEVQSRGADVKAKELRRMDVLPLAFYGKGVKPRSLQVDYQTFRRLFRKAGKNTIVELVVDGKDKLKTLVHDFQSDPITDKFLHVDMINVKMNEKIHAKVPLEFVGTAPAVKELGGNLNYMLDEVEIECLPGNLIHSIEVNLELIEDFNVVLHVSDLVVPSDVVILTDAELPVVSAAAQREELEEEAAEAPEMPPAENGGDDKKSE